MQKMYNYVLIYFLIVFGARLYSCEELCTNTSTSCSDQYCIDLITNTTYRQILFDEIRFLKILLQRLTSAGLTSIKPEHLYRTLLLASSPEVETGTLEFTRQHLLNAILENTSARKELEYEYVSRQDSFFKIISNAKSKMQRFEQKVKFQVEDRGNATENWELLTKIFDQCKKNEEINDYLMRSEISDYMIFQRWYLIAANFNEDYKTNKFCYQ